MRATQTTNGRDADMEQTDKQYIEAARRQYEKEGEIEVDETAVVSRGEDEGAYVQAWVWVSNSELEEETN